MAGILDDLTRVLHGVPEKSTDAFVDAIVDAKCVFMHGLGRSGLVARMFGMRLVHLSQLATIVGDTTAPPDPPRRSARGLLAHRPGPRFSVMRSAWRTTRGRARWPSVGDENTRLAKPADLVIRLPIELASAATPQPMGSLFEQALLLYLDGIIVPASDGAAGADGGGYGAGAQQPARNPVGGMQ